MLHLAITFNILCQVKSVRHKGHILYNSTYMRSLEADRLVVTRHWGGRNGELVFNGAEFVWDDEKFGNSDNGCTTSYMQFMPLNCMLTKS